MLALLGFATLAVLAYGFQQGSRVLFEHLAADRALRSRKLDLEERAVAVTEHKARGPAVPAIPPDLHRRITKWQDDEGQANERKIILDLYEQFRDTPDPWAAVRDVLPREFDERVSDVIFTEGMVS